MSELDSEDTAYVGGKTSRLRREREKEPLSTRDALWWLVSSERHVLSHLVLCYFRLWVGRWKYWKPPLDSASSANANSRQRQHAWSRDPRRSALLRIAACTQNAAVAQASRWAARVEGEPVDGEHDEGGQTQWTMPNRLLCTMARDPATRFSSMLEEVQETSHSRNGRAARTKARSDSLSSICRVHSVPVGCSASSPNSRAKVRAAASLNLQRGPKPAQPGSRNSTYPRKVLTSAANEEVGPEMPPVFCFTFPSPGAPLRRMCIVCSPPPPSPETLTVAASELLFVRPLSIVPHWRALVPPGDHEEKGPENAHASAGQSPKRHRAPRP